MLRFHFVAGLVIAGALAAPVLAQSVSVSYPPDQIIAARQAALEMSAESFGTMQKAMKAGNDAKTQGFAAHGLALWAKVLPTLFPEGTAKGQTPIETKARPEIWTDRAKFEKAASNYLAAAEKLSTLAEADDTVGFTAQLGEVKKTCDACHSDFRER